MIDHTIFNRTFGLLDPMNYADKLSKIPKYVIVSSNDEFMMFDQTNIYYDRLKGEKHLLIVQNSEHSMITGLYTVLSSMGTFVRSIATQ